MITLASLFPRPLNISGVRHKRWIKQLQPATRALAELAGGTEGEFLELGDKLHEFYRRADEVAKMSSSIAAKMSGAEIQSATDRLQGICDRVKLLEGESREGAANLKLLLEKFDGIKNPLSGFARVVRNLSILCNFIKIENARFGTRDTGFNTVAEDVNKLAASVESKSSQLLARSESLIFLIRETLEKIGDFEFRQRGQAGFILENTVQSLTTLGEKNRLSAGSLQNVAAMWEKISKDIGGVVTSMQFHDITRQRMEHVKEALDDVEKNLDGRRVASGDLLLAADTCELQVVQLRHASDELVDAVGQIKKNIGNIADNATVISLETQEVAGIDGKTGKSFLGKIENELSILTDAVSEYVAMNGASAAALNRVTDTVGDMSVFVEDIDKIGIEMNMIALNACVHAAHIGAEGMALGVLATSIQQLSDETSRRISTVEENLRSIIAVALELSAGTVRETGRTEEEGENMAGDLRMLTQPLRELDRDIVSLAGRIDAAGRALSEDIEKAIAGVSAHTRIAHVIGDVSGTVEDVASGLRSLMSAGNLLGRKGKRLRGLAARYTMQKERDIHSSVSVSGPAMPVLAIAGSRSQKTTEGAAESKTEEGLGENVELF